MPAVKRKAIPKAVRQQVYDSLNGHCGYCGCEITYKEMQVDHIQKAAGNAARKTGKAVYIQIGEEIWDCAGNQKASAVLF